MKSFHYVPEFDGLRAIAIILVLLTHANFQLGHYGYLGVQMFFTLSGFLITTILLNEKRESLLSIKDFYLRRVFRLLPGLILLLIFIQGYNLLFEQGDNRTAIQKEIWASLFYVYNISWLWNEGKLISHMWSLSIEEQFYLFWPWIILILANKKIFPWILTAFILLSLFIKAFWNFNVWNSLVEESLLIGCFGAIINKNTKFSTSKWLTSFLLIFLILGGIVVPSKSLPFEFALPWIVGLISLFPILSFSNGQRNLILSSSLVVFLGKISYSLYLWHVPIFKWFKWYSAFEPWQNFILKFAFTFLIAVASHHCVEKPMIAFGRKLLEKQKTA